MKSVFAQLSSMKTPKLFDEVYIASSLEKLENDYWGPPNYSSNLVKSIHKIRTLPLNELTPEHLRMSIGQNMSLPYLVPLSINLLEGEPLIEANFYSGDLLTTVLQIPSVYFEWDPKARSAVLKIAIEAGKELCVRKDIGLDKFDLELLLVVQKFIQNNTEG